LTTIHGTAIAGALAAQRVNATSASICKRASWHLEKTFGGHKEEIKNGM
jgi:hypothetical protein